MIEHSTAAPEATTFPGGIFDHGPINTPLLDFIENFIVAFVDCIDRYTPIKNRFAGVIGGSLGGSMGLRLGRLSWAWLANGIVSWSPASVWDPYVQNFPKSARTRTLPRQVGRGGENLFAHQLLY